MYTQKLYRNGNSMAVTIPKEYLTKFKLTENSEVTVEANDQEESITISTKKTIKSQSSSVTPEFLKWLEGFNKEYGTALQKLAKR